MSLRSSSSREPSLSPLAEKAVAGLLLLAAAIPLIIFFDHLPIEGTSLAIDWKQLWEGVRGGVPHYGTGLRSPVWSILPILPLGLFSFRASWGLLVLLTLMATILSVPRPLDRRLWLSSVILIVVSYPSLRHLADGNLEGLIIAGIVVALLGLQKRTPWLYAAGVLIASAKIQETWLFFLVLAVYTLKNWSRRNVIIAAAIMLAVILPSLLWTGREWLASVTTSPFPGTIIDVTLRAAIQRLGLPDWVGLMLWGIFLAVTLYVSFTSDWAFSRFKAGLLVAASLLLAPYAAGNSFLTVAAIGLIPLFQHRRWLGLTLILLADLPILASRDLLSWQAYYWTALLLISWAILVWLVRREPKT
ncbi:MAG: DUF2029 domain-containing protein [Anaerolineae bacterium]|nr:DUF2029 domain-containing protein [Anaerolineae bacterium]